jgi:NADPH2:quinone reductase
MSKNATVTGLALWQADAEALRRTHAALAAMLEARTLRPVVAEELPLAQAAEAHRRVMQPGHKGRIVLVP